MNFLQNLEKVRLNMAQIMQQHVNIEESSLAMNKIFPPDQFMTVNAVNILKEAKLLQE